jgi:prepilin peptidase CpaA
MHTIAWWPTVLVLAIAVVTDLRSRRIPNWLVLPFLLAGFIESGWQHGWHGIGQSVAGAGLGALFYGVFFLMGGMGMGDVKLCAAIGAWVGPEQLLTALVLTGIVGGLMALCWAAFSGFLGDLFKNVGNIILGVSERGHRPYHELTLANPMTRKMPYAPAIAIGTILSFISR